MIANAAFLAGLTTFILAAWLAAELSFLATYQGGYLPDVWAAHPGRRRTRVR
jgi:hypothetical protein